METEAVTALISAGMPGAEVKVTGDGRHFEALVVSPEFEGKSLIELHALSIKAYTPEQWAALSG